MANSPHERDIHPDLHPASTDPAAFVLICAPAGYDKHDRLAALLAARGGARLVQLSCRPGSPSAFWRRLLTAAAPHLGEASPSAPRDGATDGEGSASSVVPTLRALLDRAPEPLTLVIDTYEAATSTENDLALLELAHPNLSLIVVARRVTILDSPLAAEPAPVRVIGPRELAITPDEALELAAEHRVPADSQLRSALELAAGWPAAVRAALDPGTDPIHNLARFALHHLELIDENARHLLLAAAQLDAIGLEHAAEFIGIGVIEARDAARELLELGVLTAVTTPETTEFRCHSAVRAALVARAKRSSIASRTELLLQGRATRIEHTAPLTAFRFFCAAGDYAHAESVLLRSFTIITDEGPPSARTLRAVPETALVAHPTLTAALLFLSLPDPAVPPSGLERLIALWQHGLQQRAEATGRGGAGSERALTVMPDQVRLADLAQHMILLRLLGRIAESQSYATRLEALMNTAYSSDTAAAPTSPYHGSLPTFYREIAATALAAGDLRRARRNLERLRAHAERLIAAPWNGFPYGSVRTVTDVESGRRWLLAALNELAFTEFIEGDKPRCAELLAEIEAITATTGASATGLSWVGGEVARAHLAYENGDQGLLDTATERLAPVRDRIEHWPVLLIAQAEFRRREFGASRALIELQAGIDAARRSGSTVDTRGIRGEEPVAGTQQANDSLRVGLGSYRAMLCTAIGDFARAHDALDQLPPDTSQTRIERARLALFEGSPVEALLLAQGISDATVTKWMRLERCLLSSVAAWECGKSDEAFAAASSASALLAECGLGSTLWGLPYAELRVVAAAAAEAGTDVAALDATLDAVPVPARTKRYERLTEMEQRTLAAVADHHSINESATALFVTPATVKKHLNSVYRKLDAKGRDDAILVATRMGLLTRS
ncbi:MAG: hypothetical protein KDB25_05260 [Leucobacter sp.]|nr:hypothetical protein [Leucobacter sp.]